MAQYTCPRCNAPIQPNQRACGQCGQMLDPNSLAALHAHRAPAPAAPQVEYDNKGQLDRIAALVIPGEILYAVFDEKGRGTGFVGITDRRLIFMDQGYIRKKKTLVSLPFSQITAVASEDSGGLVFGTSQLIVIAGSREWDFEFRSNDKAHRAYQLMMGNLLQYEKPGIMHR